MHDNFPIPFNLALFNFQERLQFFGFSLAGRCFLHGVSDIVERLVSFLLLDREQFLLFLCLSSQRVHRLGSLPQLLQTKGQFLKLVATFRLCLLVDGQEVPNQFHVLQRTTLMDVTERFVDLCDLLNFELLCLFFKEARHGFPAITVEPDDAALGVEGRVGGTHFVELFVAVVETEHDHHIPPHPLHE